MLPGSQETSQSLLLEEETTYHHAALSPNICILRSNPPPQVYLEVGLQCS